MLVGVVRCEWPCELPGCTVGNGGDELSTGMPSENSLKDDGVLPPPRAPSEDDENGGLVTPMPGE